MPKVSVITPLFNKAGTIRATIESVQGQTMADWEMIVVDNGSTDGSLEEAGKIQDDRIRILRNDGPGPGSARNGGLAVAGGQWIQFLDADDLLEPDQFEVQLDVAGRVPDAGVIVGSWQEFCDETPAHRRLCRPAGWRQPGFDLKDYSIAFAPWAVHAAIVRRSALEGEPPWAVELDPYLGEDIAFWFRVLQKTQVAYSPARGALYRVKTTGRRNQDDNAEKWFAGIHAVVGCNLGALKPTPGQCEYLMRLYCRLYRSAGGHRGIQERCLREAVFWLESYFKKTDKPKAAMRLRRLLGLKWFLALDRLRHRS